MPVNYGGAGVVPSLGALVSNVVSLAAAETWLIPSGRWGLKPGRYTCVQEYDPITTIWRSIGGGATWGTLDRVVSDGANYRLANLTGCAVGALITNAGTAYTSAPTIAPTGGSSVWKAIVGGALNTSVTVSNGGSNYTYPPTVLIAPPPSPGIQATAHATLSSGAVGSVVIDDQGAGYTSPPTIILVNDPREGLNGTTVGTGATAVASLTGSGTITGVLCLDPGKAVTSVPTFTITGGGGSALAITAIMNWCITAYAVSNSGTGATGSVIFTVYDQFPTTNPIYTNVSTQSQLVKTRPGIVLAGLTVTVGNVTTAGAVVLDAGIFTAVPTVYAVASSAAIGSTAPVVTWTMGGVTDVSQIFPT